MFKRPWIVLGWLLPLLAWGGHEGKARGAAGPPRRVDALGDPLPNGAVARLGTIRFRHAYSVHVLAYSPDGTKLATIGSNMLCVWDAATGKELFSAAFPIDSFRAFSSVGFSPDGKTLVATCWVGTIRLFDVSTGKVVRSWSGHTDVAWIGGFTADGNTLATSSRDGTIRLWDWRTGRQRMSFEFGSKSIVHCALSADGKTVAGVGPRPYGLRIWDAVSGKQKHVVHLNYNGSVFICFTPDQKTLMTVRSQVSFWDVKTGKEVHPIRVPGNQSNCVAFSPDGKVLAVTGYGMSEIHCFDWKSGKIVARIPCGYGSPAGLTFAPGGKTLAMGGTGQASVRFFAWETGKELSGPVGHTGPVRSLVFAPDGKSLFSAGNRSVRWWDVSQAKQRHRFSGQVNPIQSVALSPDGRILAAGGGAAGWPQPPGRILLWDVVSKKQLADISYKDLSQVVNVSFAADGRSLLSGAAPWGWDMWEVPTGKSLHGKDMRRLETCSGAVFASDGQFVVSAHEQNLKIWTAATGHLRQTITEPISRSWSRQTPPLAVSANGQWIAVGDRRGHVCMYEVATGLRALEFTAYKEPVARHLQPVQCIAFSPDGRLVASATYNHELKIWDLLTGQELASLPGHRGWINAVAFSPTGDLLASGSSDATILLWNIAGVSRKPLKPTKLTDRELKDLWDSLGRPDAGNAFRTIYRLIDDPEGSLPFITKQVSLPDSPFPSQDQIRAWIADLDSDTFRTREQATRKLEDAGHKAEELLAKTLKEKNSLEVQMRIRRLLKTVQGSAVSPGLLRWRRGVEVLEGIGTPGARKTLEELKRKGLTGASSALRRLDRRQKPGR